MKESKKQNNKICAFFDISSKYLSVIFLVASTPESVTKREDPFSSGQLTGGDAEETANVAGSLISESSQSPSKTTATAQANITSSNSQATLSCGTTGEICHLPPNNSSSLDCGLQSSNGQFARKLLVG